MTEQLKKIKDSIKIINENIPNGFRAGIALILEKEFKIPEYFKVKGLIKLEKLIPDYNKTYPSVSGELIFGTTGSRNIFIIRNRLHFYDGFSMRLLGHFIYVLKFLGVKTIISTDEVAALNPRFSPGELCLIYDHINLMGDNPLIGENDDSLGLRFPDMSNAYDDKLFKAGYSVFQNEKIKANESVYLGIIGPESETEAEARFYREIGADVVGYSLIPENITAVHCNIRFFAIGLITRELIADKMMLQELTEPERNKQRKLYLNKANKLLEKMLKPILSGKGFK